jgi:hypothetical protein
MGTHRITGLFTHRKQLERYALLPYLFLFFYKQTGKRRLVYKLPHVLCAANRRFDASLCAKNPKGRYLEINS